MDPSSVRSKMNCSAESWECGLSRAWREQARETLRGFLENLQSPLPSNARIYYNQLVAVVVVVTT